jgi:hypothetical protein
VDKWKERVNLSYNLSQVNEHPIQAWQIALTETRNIWVVRSMGLQAKQRACAKSLRNEQQAVHCGWNPRVKVKGEARLRRKLKDRAWDPTPISLQNCSQLTTFLCYTVSALVFNSK